MALPAVLAAIQIGVSVAQMLGPKGSSMGDLLAVQTEMLKNISNQLGVIQGGIETILVRINEVEELIGKVPQKTLELFSDQDLKTKILQYDEIFSGYNKELQKNGVKSAFAKYNDLFVDDLIDPIQQYRTAVFSYHQPITIPLVSLCLGVEITAMILMHDDPRVPNTRIQAALEKYQKWLNQMLDKDYPQSAFKVYADLRTAQSNILKKVTNLTYPSICVHSVVSDQVWVKGELFFDEWVNLYGQKYRLLTSPALSNSETEQINPLVESDLVSQDDLPFKTVVRLTDNYKTGQVKVFPVQTARVKGGWIDTDKKFPLRNDKDFPSDKSMSELRKFPACDSLTEANATDIPVETADALAVSKESETNGYSLLSYASLVQVANESLIIVNKFLDDPLLNQ
jgi:hypothetical protein